MLQAISFEQQSKYFETKILADTAILGLVSHDDATSLQRAIFDKFDTLRGLLFNQYIDNNRVDARNSFAEQVKRELAAGTIGPAPKNLSPDLKLSQDEAKLRKDEGEEVPTWYIRTDEEEVIVAKMIEDWNNAQENAISTK